MRTLYFFHLQHEWVQLLLRLKKNTNIRLTFADDVLVLLETRQADPCGSFEDKEDEEQVDRQEDAEAGGPRRPDLPH